MTELATNGSLQTLLCVGGTRLQREESCFGRWLIVERSAVLLEVSLKIFRRKSTIFLVFFRLKSTILLPETVCLRNAASTLRLNESLNRTHFVVDFARFCLIIQSVVYRAACTNNAAGTCWAFDCQTFNCIQRRIRAFPSPRATQVNCVCVLCLL